MRIAFLKWKEGAYITVLERKSICNHKGSSKEVWHEIYNFMFP